MKKRRRSRQERNPDTAVFHFYNANPKNRITGDCTFRAIATAMEKPWEVVVMEMAEMSCRTGYAINDKLGIECYLKEQGWVKHRQPRWCGNLKYTGAEFCLNMQQGGTFEELQNVNVVANIGGHHITCIKNAKVHDIWDCTGKCIGNYWTKEEL